MIFPLIVSLLYIKMGVIDWVKISSGQICDPCFQHFNLIKHDLWTEKAGNAPSWKRSNYN